MTLALINVTAYGVVMAADDALTERYGTHTRILHGATKLFAHYKCHCGLATWGAGTLPNKDTSKAPVATEFIVKQFIREARDVESVEVLLAGLVSRLDGEFRKADLPAMIDIAGCKRVDEKWQPFVYDIGNCDDPYADTPVIRRFRSRVVRLVGPYEHLIDNYPIVNGVTNAGYWTDAQFDAFVAAAEVTENSALVPGNSLDQRAAFLGAVARSVSDIHLTMNLSRSIGPEVITLTVSSTDGIVTIRD